MAKISTYPLDSTPNLGDKLIGTDVNDSNATKNLTIGQILSVPGSSAYVPYTGATSNVDLGSYDITSNAFIKLGGLSTEFLKADGSVDSNTYLPTTLSTGKLWYGSAISVATETTTALEYYPTSPAGGAVVKMASRLYADVTSQNDATSLVIGKNAGIGISGTTHIGVNAGFNNTADQNTFIGNNAGNATTPSATAEYNTAVGYSALGGSGLTSYGVQNSFLGYEAGAYSVTSDNNVGVGYRAFHDNVNSGANTAIGSQSMYQMSGDYNSALGIQSLGESSGDNNVGIGNSAGLNNVGDNGIFIGESAGATNNSSDTIAIGNSAANGNTANGSIVIGNDAGQTNSGDGLITIGRESAGLNSGSNVIGIGAECLGGNSGSSVISIGFNSGNGNTFDNVVLIGDSANATADNQMAILANPVGSIMARVDYNNLTASRNVNFPDADGTMVLSVNGTAPDAAGNVTVGSTYLVYTALLTLSLGSVTANVLENTIGDGSGDGINDIAWSEVGGDYLATMTAGPFTLNKTLLMPGLYVASNVNYTFMGSRTSSSVVTYKSRRTDDNSLSTAFTSNIFVEIRVYP